MVRAAPCTDNVGARDTAELFLKYVFKDFGMPTSIISDRGTQFTGAFTKQLCRIFGTRQNLSTSFHPETDGQTERMNRSLEEFLRHFVNGQQSDWDKYLPLAEFAINNSWNESIRCTPFYLNYFRHPRLPCRPQFLPGIITDENILTDYSPNSLLLFAATYIAGQVPSAHQFAQKMQQCVREAQRAIRVAQDRQKKFADLRRQPLEFSVGDLVLLRTKNLKFPGRASDKFRPKWVGPFKILARVGKVAYKLQLAPKMRIHPVFHVNLLKRWFSDPNRPIHPEPLIIEGNEEFEIAAILDHRPKSATGPQHRGLQYLVSYVCYGPEHNQWIAKRDMSHAKALIQEYWKRPRSRNLRAYAKQLDKNKRRKQ